MLYIIHCGEKVRITEDNVRSLCPNCGADYSVNLLEALQNYEGDVSSFKMLCPYCSKDF